MIVFAVILLLVVITMFSDRDPDDIEYDIPPKSEDPPQYVSSTRVFDYGNYSQRDHYKLDKGCVLRDNAKVVDVDHRFVGSKQERKIRTDVTFDDGFTYISYTTSRDDGFLSYTVSLTDKEVALIVDVAIAVHRQLIEKQSYSD